MKKITVTIRGMDDELVKQVKIKSIRDGVKPADWLNDAIKQKLLQEAMDLPYNLDSIAERTDVVGVFRVPVGTILVGNDYVIEGRKICAAGRKDDEEVVTYDNPGSIHNLGYQIFWVR